MLKVVDGAMPVKNNQVSHLPPDPVSVKEDLGVSSYDVNFLFACWKTCSSPVKVGLRSGAGEPWRCLHPAQAENQTVEFAALVCVPSVNLMEPRRVSRPL